MSDKYVARALRSNADFSTQERLALMLLADGANDDGQVRAVSEDHIAEIMRTALARQSERAPDTPLSLPFG